MQVPKPLSDVLAKSEPTLHAIVMPTQAAEIDGGSAKRVEDMTTERLQAAHTLQNLGSRYSQQAVQDLFEEMRQNAEQAYDPGKRLEQMTAANNIWAQRREAHNVVMDDRKTLL